MPLLSMESAVQWRQPHDHGGIDNNSIAFALSTTAPYRFWELPEFQGKQKLIFSLNCNAYLK